MSKENPLILVTNDDGITAPGILTLIETAKIITNNMKLINNNISNDIFIYILSIKI